MAFPASQQTVEDALSQIRRAAITLRRQIQSLRDESAAGVTNRADYINLQIAITRALQQWQQAAAVQGLSAYAQSQYDDATLDIAAEYLAMKSAAESLRLWIFNNIPKQGDTPLLHTIDIEGTLTNLTVSSAAAAGFRTEADTFLATVG